MYLHTGHSASTYAGLLFLKGHSSENGLRIAFILYLTPHAKSELACGIDLGRSEYTNRYGRSENFYKV
jgi:hypothetical protein